MHERFGEIPGRIFLGAFEKLRKATISSSAATGRIFMKFGI
jgi:hypothetical protein